MNRLRELREDAGLTLSEVAAQLGTHNTAISKYELEQRQLTPDLIAKFCSLYHVTSDYLLGLSDERMPAVVTAAASPDLLEVAKIIASFTPEQTELFLKIVERETKNEK